ncbi:hypothetical protein KO489_00535 [Reinekea forsetii]|nr:hypothetical protein [Reinekea forsetii]
MTPIDPTFPLAEACDVVLGNREGNVVKGALTGVSSDPTDDFVEEATKSGWLKLKLTIHEEIAMIITVPIIKLRLSTPFPCTVVYPHRLND